MKIDIPYGKTVLSADIPDIRVSAVLNNRLHDYEPLAAADELVEQALASPISSPPLCELAKGKKNVVILASDHPPGSQQGNHTSHAAGNKTV